MYQLQTSFYGKVLSCCGGQCRVLYDDGDVVVEDSGCLKIERRAARSRRGNPAAPLAAAAPPAEALAGSDSDSEDSMFNFFTPAEAMERAAKERARHLARKAREAQEEEESSAAAFGALLDAKVAQGVEDAAAEQGAAGQGDPLVEYLAKVAKDKAAKVAKDKAMEARVTEEMRVTMDTGVRVNPALAAFHGVPGQLAPEPGAAGEGSSTDV